MTYYWLNFREFGLRGLSNPPRKGGLPRGAKNTLRSEIAHFANISRVWYKQYMRLFIYVDPRDCLLYGTSSVSIGIPRSVEHTSIILILHQYCFVGIGIQICNNNSRVSIFASLNHTLLTSIISNCHGSK